MKFVVQRVSHASVTVEGEVCGKIEKGFMVLIGVGQNDDENIADKMVQKLINMRIFEDENGKTNLALKDVGGQLLLISQFTLYANCKKKVTARLLSMREARIKLMHYMNILLKNAVVKLMW